MKKNESMSRFLSYAVILFFITFTLLFLYAFASINIIVAKNDSNERLEAVQIFFESEKIWTGRIAPGEQKFGFFRAEVEGGMLIKYCIEQQCFEQEFGYVTPGIAMKHDIVLDEAFFQDSKLVSDADH